jgi:hypothetical protein
MIFLLDFLVKGLIRQGEQGTVLQVARAGVTRRVAEGSQVLVDNIS